MKMNADRLSFYFLMAMLALSLIIGLGLLVSSYLK